MMDEKTEMSETDEYEPVMDPETGKYYPRGFEPELEGRELEIARKKESAYTWMVRLGLLAILIMIIMIVVFALTSH